MTRRLMKRRPEQLLIEDFVALAKRVEASREVERATAPEQAGRPVPGTPDAPAAPDRDD